MGLRVFVCALCFAALTGCGYQGDPRPPSLQIPVAITDLTAVERGSKIIVDFTVPIKTTDNLPLKDDPYFELHVGEERRRVRTGHYEMDATPFYTQTVKVAIKVQNAKGRDAGYSNIIDLEVRPAVAKPEDLRAAAVARGVQLTWRSGDRLFVVYRQGPDDKDFVRLGTADARTFTDENAEFGKRYRYEVQTIASPAESDRTDAVEITPVDVFPPAVPVNVAAVVGPASVELAWDRAPDLDLAGYRIYRDGKKVGETGLGPSFSDKTVEAGRRYRYTVTSFDKLNNESAPSEPVDTKN